MSVTTTGERERLEPILAGSGWTAADLLARFGPIALSRIRHDPAPGQATEADVLELREAHRRLFELIDGVLVEKAVGVQESYVATLLAGLLARFLAEHDLGFLLGADGMARLAPGLVRIPDVSFVTWERLGGRSVPEGPFLTVAPDLAVEVLSPSNTDREMATKLADYFAAGVRLVWLVDPASRTVAVLEGLGRAAVLDEAGTLEGGAILPGFAVPVARLFEGLARKEG
jgi:Uma2 family endonuclease